MVRNGALIERNKRIHKDRPEKNLQQSRVRLVTKRDFIPKENKILVKHIQHLIKEKEMQTTETVKPNQKSVVLNNVR